MSQCWLCQQEKKPPFNTMELEWQRMNARQSHRRSYLTKKIFIFTRLCYQFFQFEIIMLQHSIIHCYLNTHFQQITIIKLQHKPNHEATPNFHVLLCLISNITISLQSGSWEKTWWSNSLRSSVWHVLHEGRRMEASSPAQTAAASASMWSCELLRLHHSQPREVCDYSQPFTSLQLLHLSTWAGALAHVILTLNLEQTKIQINFGAVFLSKKLSVHLPEQKMKQISIWSR